MSIKSDNTHGFDRVEFKQVGHTEPIFTLDMNKKCPRCGKDGASDKGVCLDCALGNAKALNVALESADSRK